MLIWENIKFAFSALFNNKIRSFLTMLGIIIGVFAVSTLMSIGEGLRNEFGSQVEQLGSNVIVVTPGKIDEENFNPSASFGVSTITMDDVHAIQDRVSSVEKNTSLTLLSGTVLYEGAIAQNLLPISTTHNYFDILDNEIAAGQYFSQNDEDDKNRVIVLGGSAAKTIFSYDFTDAEGEKSKAEGVIGKKVEFLGEEFEVIGVLKNKEEALNFGGSDTNDVVLVPRDTAVEITGENTVFRILNRIRSAEEVDGATTDIKNIMLTQHKGVEDFTVLTQEDVLNVFNSFFNILNEAIIGIAAISLIVGGIGIMNIMLVSVTERTREIGLRKAIGATAGNILFQFLVEASALSIIGGALGVVLSFVAAKIISEYFNIPTDITMNSIYLAFGISVGVGVIFGITPASKAGQKSPIEALRYE